MIVVNENSRSSSLTAQMNEAMFADLHAAVDQFTARIQDEHLKAVVLLEHHKHHRLL